MDWILNRTVEQSPLGVSIGREHFTDLDYADDVALLAEMLQTLVAGLLVLQDEAVVYEHGGTGSLLICAL